VRELEIAEADDVFGVDGSCECETRQDECESLHAAFLTQNV